MVGGTTGIRPFEMVDMEAGKQSLRGSERDSADNDLPNRWQKSSTPWWRSWSYFTAAAFPGKGDHHNYDYHSAPSDETLGEESTTPSNRDRRQSARSTVVRRMQKALCLVPFIVLCLFGCIHIIIVLYGSRQFLFSIDRIQAPPLPPVALDKDLSTYPTDATRDVHPIGCNSHNDYWRKVPFYDAIQHGCISVEADVWEVDGEEELLVGHSYASLTHNRTLRSLYVDPLLQLLNSMNPEAISSQTPRRGVFDIDPEQTLTLLIDFKTDGYALFPLVSQQLEPLRQAGYLSYWDGGTFHSQAVTVVGTGNAPYDRIVQDQHHRDIFFDAPLGKLWEALPTEAETPHSHGLASRDPAPAQGQTGTEIVTSPDDFNSSNSYFASVSFIASVGIPWTGRLSDAQLETIRGQIRGAKRRGLKARYWSAPVWPTSLRNYIWETLVREGADILNVDDLQSAATLDWASDIGHYLLDGK